MNSTTISVDVAKAVFEVAVSNHPGSVAERHRLSRSRFLEFFAQRQPTTVLLEACSSTHHWARRLQSLGYRVLLLPPHAVRPYVTSNKTDRADAKGLLEAFRNRDIHPVPVKTLDQQTLSSLHRLRSAWVSTRTSRINCLRGVLREFGFAIPLGAHRAVSTVGEILQDADSELPNALRPSVAEALSEIQRLEERIQGVERQLKLLVKQDPTATRLQGIPGIGFLTASALVAFVGDIQRFPSARHFASYLGLTPRETSSGLQRRLGAISKRGDSYLRQLLIHGARAVLYHAKQKNSRDRLRAWALKIEGLRGHNKAGCALANKIARIAWAVWKKNSEYQNYPIPKGE
jgi:transposase